MSCLNTASKYFLFLTNFLVFGLGIAVLACGAWVLIDKPSFLNVLDEAENICEGSVAGCDGLSSSVALYSSAAYILIAISVLAVLISFFGCCGAWKENRCMLGTYFTIVLALFVAMLVGAIIAYSGNIEDQIKKPLKDSIKLYDESKQDKGNIGFRAVMDELQTELQCCGIDGVGDWAIDPSLHNFPSGYNKPVGCCHGRRDGQATDIGACRRDNTGPDSETYYFKGCWTSLKDQVEDQQSIVVGVAIGVVVVMFLNMLFSFSMCMMVKN